MKRVDWCLAVLALSGVVVACDKGGGDDGGVSTDRALTELADSAEAHAAANGSVFAETGVMVYCREGSSIPGSVFAEVGFHPPEGTASWTYCYNVSGDRARVALTVAESPMADESRCLTVDFSSGAPVRSELTTTASCLP